MSLDYHVEFSGSISCTRCKIVEYFRYIPGPDQVRYDKIHLDITDYVYRTYGFKYCESCDEPCCKSCITLDDFCVNCREQDDNDDKYNMG